MPLDVVSLSCRNCGGRLEVCPDLDRFACHYCGTELIVQRRGGTVSLQALSDALDQVKTGTEKTAAELALVRLQKEMDELRAAESELQGQSSGRFNQWTVFGLACAAVGTAVLFESVILGGVLIVAGGVFGLAGWGTMTSHKRATIALEKKIAALHERIVEKRRIADA